MIVVVAVTDKQVLVTDQFATAPITGRDSIFARVPRETSTVLDVRVVGVFTSLLDAEKAEQLDKASHPEARYVKQQVKANLLPGQQAPVEARCIKCGERTQGASFCEPCRKAHFAECNALDPLGGAPDPETVKVPV